MKCDDCKYAEWKLTASGRKHPSKSGKCTRLQVHPLDLRLPAAFYWLSATTPNGGHITRGEELPTKCIFMARKGA